MSNEAMVCALENIVRELRDTNKYQNEMILALENITMELHVIGKLLEDQFKIKGVTDSTLVHKYMERRTPENDG